MLQLHRGQIEVYDRTYGAGAGAEREDEYRRSRCSVVTGDVGDGRGHDGEEKIDRLSVKPGDATRRRKREGTMKSIFHEGRLKDCLQVRYGYFAIIWLAMAQGCLATESQPTSDLQFSWMECDSPTHVYFTVDISKDGGARYTGGPRAKVTNARDFRLSAGDTKKLLSAANQVARLGDFKTSTSAKDMNRRWASPFCLRVWDSKHKQAGLAKLSDSRAKRLNQVAERLTHFKQWVCPARLGLLSEEDACGLPLIRYAFERQDTCRATDLILIYPSGYLLHIFGNDESMNAYFTILPDEALQLARSAVSFQVIGNESETEQNASPRFVRGTAIEQAAFVQQLEKFSSTSWSVLSAAPNACVNGFSSYAPYLGIFVYEDRFANLTKKQKH